MTVDELVSGSKDYVAGGMSDGMIDTPTLESYLYWPEPAEGQRRKPENPNDKLVIIAGP